MSRRRSEAQRPSAESTPPARGQRIRSIPSSAAIAAACIGPAPPNGSRAKRRGSTPRSTVTTRSARTISWLAIADDPLGGLELARGRARRPAPADRRARRRRRRGRRRRPGVESGGEDAEQEVGVGDRRLGPAAPVAGGPGVGAGRARPDAQRAAAVAPPDRAAAGADGVDVDHRQLDHAALDLARVGAPAPRRPRRRRRRRRCRPCRGRARCRRRRRGRSGRRRPRRRPARRGRSRRPPAPPRRRRRRRPRTASRPGAAAPRPPAASPRRPEVAAEQGREVGVDRGRRAALVLAEAGQHLVRGGDVDAGQLARAGARRCAARGRGRGRRRAGRSATDSAPLSRTSSARRSRLAVAAAARRRPSGPTRSAASKRSSRPTSGVGFGAQSR